METRQDAGEPQREGCVVRILSTCQKQGTGQGKLVVPLLGPKTDDSVDQGDTEVKADLTILECAIVQQEDPGNDKYHPRHFTQSI